MAISSKELVEKRVTLAKQAEAILTKAHGEKRSMTGEENAEFDRIHTDVDLLGKEIEAYSKQERLSAVLNEKRDNGGIGRESRTATATAGTEARSRELWNKYLTEGKGGLDSVQAAELRALSTITGASGGYIAPAIAAQGFTDLLRNWSDIRNAPVTILPTLSGNPFPWPVGDDTANVGDTTAEAVAMASTGGDPTFTGTITYSAYNVDSKIVLVPLQLIQDSVIDITAYLNKKLAERIGMKENLLCTTGSGSSAPQGIVTGASASGVTLPAADLGSGTPGTAAYAASVIGNLTDIETSVIPAYRRSKACGWMLNDGTRGKLKKITDGMGRPLWQPSLQAGVPDQLNGYSVYLNDQIAAVATGNKSILFGDFSQFQIRDVGSIEVFTFHEKYMDQKMVGYAAFHRIDSHVLSSAALKYAVHA